MRIEAFSVTKDIRWLCSILDVPEQLRPKYHVELREKLTSERYIRILKHAILLARHQPRSVKASEIITIDVNTGLPYKPYGSYKKAARRLGTMYQKCILPLFTKKEIPVIIRNDKGTKFHLKLLHFLYISFKNDQQRAFLLYVNSQLKCRTWDLMVKLPPRRSKRAEEPWSKRSIIDLKGRLQDPALTILRLSNYVSKDISAADLCYIFQILRQSTVIQVLYVQNFRYFDDMALNDLCSLITYNPRIWAVNVGENALVSQRAWNSFADRLSETMITHLYVGTETTVYGHLKKNIVGISVANRKKHGRHWEHANWQVITRVKHMWRNPPDTAAQYRLMDNS